MARVGFSPIDRERWLAVSKALTLVEREGGSVHGVRAEDALCTLIVWAEDHPDDPAAAWLKRSPSQRQRVAFEREFKRLCP